MEVSTNLRMTDAAVAALGYPPEVVAQWSVRDFFLAAWKAGYDVEVSWVDANPDDGGVIVQVISPAMGLETNPCT